MRKKIGIFLTLLLMFNFCFGLMACDNNGEGNGEGVEGTITIRYFQGGYGSKWLQDATNAYKALNPGVKFKLDRDETLNDNAIIYLSNKNKITADIYMTNYFNWQEAAINNWIEPLDDLMEAPVGEFGGQQVTLRESLVDGMQDYPYIELVYQDPSSKHAYNIPWTANCASIVYNEDLMKKVPKTGGGFWTVFPQTENEFMQFIDDINASSLTSKAGKKVAPFVTPGTQIGSYYWFHQIWWAQYQGISGEGISGEGNWYDFWKYKNSGVYNQTGIVEGYRLLQKALVDTSAQKWKNLPAGNGSLSAQDAQLEFIKGSAVMSMFGSWLENETKDLWGSPNVYEKLEQNLRMAYLPLINGYKVDKVNDAMIGSTFVLAQNSQNKDIAKDFLLFLNSQENMKKFTETTGIMRPYKYNPLTLNPSFSWSNFQKDSITMFLEGNNLFETSTHPFFTHLNKTAYQPTLACIGNLLTQTPEQVAFGCYDYADKAWDNWLKQAGISA